MMVVSGWFTAKCKSCGKEMDWYIDFSMPFVDSEIIGTCDDCIKKSEDNG